MTGTMLVKWIICSVRPAHAARFDRGQRAWAALSTAPGFRGQLGGWDRGRSSTACIVGLWDDRAAYDAFMSTLHDPIYEANGQRGSFDGSTVVLSDAPDVELGALRRVDALCVSTDRGGGARPLFALDVAGAERLSITAWGAAGRPDAADGRWVDIEPAWTVEPV